MNITFEIRPQGEFVSPSATKYYNKQWRTELIKKMCTWQWPVSSPLCSWCPLIGHISAASLSAALTYNWPVQSTVVTARFNASRNTVCNQPISIKLNIDSVYAFKEIVSSLLRLILLPYCRIIQSRVLSIRLDLQFAILYFNYNF